jgi:hypothetical protein
MAVKGFSGCILTFAVMGLIVAVIGVAMNQLERMGIYKPAPSAEEQLTPQQVAARDSTARYVFQEGSEILDELMKQGVVRSWRTLDGGQGWPDIIEIEVRSRFYGMDFADKEALVIALSAIPDSGRSVGSVWIVDAKSGKRVGDFNRITGFRMK